MKIEENATTTATGLGIAGFICATLGLISSWFPPLSIPLSLIGIVLSVVQRKRNPTGFAIAGIVLGIIGLVIGLALVAIPLFIMGVPFLFALSA